LALTAYPLRSIGAASLNPLSLGSVVQTLAAQLELPVLETSAKNRINVEEAFLLRTREYIHNQLLMPPSQTGKAKPGALSGVSLTTPPADGSAFVSCCK
jgi:hypothetical protein